MTEKTLTEHQRKLLHLVALGYSDEQIAQRLGLKVHSATFAIYRLRCKLHLYNRAQMVTYALRVGVVTTDELLHPYGVEEG